MAGFNRQVLRAYVLIGYQGDIFAAAEERLQAVLKLGVFPMAMLYRDDSGQRDQEWARFQRQWARPASISTRQLQEVE